MLEQLKLVGPTLDVALEGTYGSAADPKALSVKGQARKTAARTALRLWPNAVVPKVRAYLVANLRGGSADLIDVAVALSGADLANAVGDGPIPDSAVKVAFAVSGAELKIADGLPPVSALAASGLATGTKAEVRAPSARVQMPEGRVLDVLDGTFDVPDVWSKEAPAAIALRLEGGADALGALLNSPLLQGVSGVDLDPAGIKGRAALRVGLNLPLKKVPGWTICPCGSRGGSATSRSRRPSARNASTAPTSSSRYANGSVAMKGEGRLWGVPASIEVRQPKAVAGEAFVSFVLDDAARARKGISFGQQLTGPVPVKVALPLGPNAKAGAKVEVDLTRAVIDNLVPGWVKPTGRPGKLSFLVPEGSTELREFVLDSGTVQMRGAVTLSARGAAREGRSQLVQAFPRRRHAGAARARRRSLQGRGARHRRGCAAFHPQPDARPARARKPRRRRMRRDVDLDVSTNILTGFNDEALTAATFKATIRHQETDSSSSSAASCARRR